MTEVETTWSGSNFALLLDAINTNSNTLRNDFMDEIKAINTNINTLRNDFNTLRNDFNSLRIDVTDEIKALRETEHDRNHKRATTILSSTELYFCVTPENGTGIQNIHSIFHNGRFFRLTVDHGCKDFEEGSVTCEGTDVRLLAGCPRNTTALNVTNAPPLRIGDEASAAAYVFDGSHGKRARFWSGMLAGRLSNTKENIALDDKTPLLAEEFCFEAGHLGGMSGAAVANGRGYTGMAHVVLTANSSWGNYVMVIPFSAIAKCIENLNATALSAFPENCNAAVENLLRAY
jgi:hypothetical protein